MEADRFHSQNLDSPYLAAIEVEKGDCLCSDDYIVQFRLEREDEGYSKGNTGLHTLVTTEPLGLKFK